MFATDARWDDPSRSPVRPEKPAGAGRGSGALAACRGRFQPVPISYLIDPARQIVRTTATGTLTDDDIMDMKRRLATDAAFRPGMRELADVRAVTELQVTSLGVRRMLALDAEQTAREAGHRLAIVACQDEVFGMARMYETLSTDDPPPVGVFRTYAEAAAWLGITDADAPA
jgi:hypothetical protein